MKRLSVALAVLSAALGGLTLGVSACSVEMSGPHAEPTRDAAAQEVPSADALFDAYLEQDRALAAAIEADGDLSVTEALALRVERDQTARRLIIELLETPGAGPDDAALTWFRLMRHMNAIDRNNTRWLKARLGERVWFTISEYGEEADNNAFLIVQHATHDPDFMREVHTRFEALRADGEIAPDNYALLTDRLAVMDDEPQPYGSQFECKDGEQRLQTPLADTEAVVDARRAEAGLPPLAQYRAALPDCGAVPGG